MITYYTPWTSTKNLGQYYNSIMENCSTRYACFIDGDAMFLMPHWGKQIEEIVSAHPNAGLFTCMVNRVGTDYQCEPGMWGIDNIQRHREMAEHIYKIYGNKVIDVTDNSPISGVMMIVKHNEWHRVGGFVDNGKALGVDNSIHLRLRKKGGKVLLMRGIYLYHYYRGGNRKDKKHLL